MDDLDKLAKLLRHWMEHNDAHAETYREWAHRASMLGRDDLSEVLKRLHDETRRMRGLFEEAFERVQQVR
jgi:transposase